MSTTTPADGPTPVLGWLAGLMLVGACVPLPISSIFLGGQAWYAFTDPDGAGAYVWGTICAICFVAPFVATPVAVFWTRRRGLTWAMSLLVGAGTAFAAIFGGVLLAMMTAAVGAL